jgi:DNA-binding response OmpR family regulator
LRADPRTHDLPLVIISACTQYEVEAGLEVGVDAFLAKPFEPTELVSVVRELMERRKGDGVSGAGVDLKLGLGIGPVLGAGEGVGAGKGGGPGAGPAAE